MTHVDWPVCKENMRLQHEKTGFVLSANTKKDNTRALVKVDTQNDPTWTTIVDGHKATGVILQEFTPAQHDDAAALVTASDWAPEPAP